MTEVGSKVVAEIEAQKRMLLRTRAVFPHVGADAVGSVRAKTAPFYQKHGFGVEFEFPEPLTPEDIKDVNEVGHWINENFLVRLYAILNSNRIVSADERIKTDLAGSDEIDILRRLRHEIAHAGGRYDPADGDSKKLRERIIEHFSLDPKAHPESAERFPLPIDKVIIPLANACREYALAYEHRTANE